MVKDVDICSLCIWHTDDFNDEYLCNLRDGQVCPLHYLELDDYI